MNKFILRIFFVLTFSFSLIHAQDVAFIDHDPSQVDFDPTQMITEAPRVKRARAKYKKVKAKDQAKEQRQKKRSNSNAAIPDTWKLKFDYPINIIQPQNSLYYQFNVGVGFLYFSNVKANLLLTPAVVLPIAIPDFTAPLKGSYSYNRTPLFESVIGYRILPWFKLGLSYQHQSGVTFQTAATDSISGSGFNSNFTTRANFISDVSLDGLMAKFCFEGAYPAVIRKVVISPSLSLGIGIGWQTWARNKAIYYQPAAPFAPSTTALMRQKVSANCIWMADLGLRFQGIDINSDVSVVLGCKYNQWGQARNVGKLSQQGTQKLGFVTPFHIKTVYQFAPYLGFQWNIPNTYVSKRPYTIDGRNPNRFVPMFAHVSHFQPSKSLWTQFNAGVGFLYFSKVRANYALIFNGVKTVSAEIDAPLRGRLGYNRTPLFEYLVGYRFLSWFKPALSYQHQGQIVVQSSAKNRTNFDPTLGFLPDSLAQFTSNLSLDALELKFFFELPYPMLLKNVSCSPFLATGVGIGWQTWSRQYILYSQSSNNLSSIAGPRLHSKISQNLVWGVDAGFRWQSAFPNSGFSLLTGCKYNQWGQARSIGKPSQQASSRYALAVPLKIKTVYQFSPYLGVQWNFTSDYACISPYSIDGKSINCWKPFFVNISNLQPANKFWTQFNVAPGFVYFSGVKANLALKTDSFSFFNSPSVPYKGRLTYNKTPLFEYVLGYDFLPWFKLGLSYQHQGGITVQSKWLTPIQSQISTQFQFISNLSLDGIILKNYFEIPKALIIKSVATNPYIALGLGSGWQTWSRPQIDSTVVSLSLFNSASMSARQKISANVIWMVDTGFRIRSAFPDPCLEVLLGCKYNQWGQARSVGKTSQQGRSKVVSFVQPFSIKVVYQFAPYVGVQWNF